MHIHFDATFERLTGTSPFPWQRELFERFMAQRIPDVCAIPTGLGKTSVIAVWLIARAAGAALPRRLVYVVNRRTVVDQTTVEVQRIRERSSDAGLLQPLAISTLRGQMADNREWSEDPARPAVISGTVDMIGSRLLFSGYRTGFKTKPLHAGFLGQDALIVHDESHLEPAFQTLLEAIAAEQRRSGDPWPLKLMALSATARTSGDTLSLTAADRSHTVVARRIGATKRLILQPCGEKELAAATIERVSSFEESGRAILVFLRTVDAVNRVVTGLPKGLRERTRALTGTMRGYERDALVDSDPVFGRFLPHRATEGTLTQGTVVLVSTSAGEVGVNLSADHLVSDLSTFDAMAQRFGRVNRFGERDDAEVHVLHPTDEVLDAAVDAGKDPSADSLRATLALLQDLKGDASPAAIEQLPPERRRAAFAPSPELVPTSSILFDAWAMTTIRGNLPGRPPVAEYLHGVAPWEPPTLQVAWRNEVELVTGPLLAEYPPTDLIEDFPLKPHELLSDRAARVIEALVDAVDADEVVGRAPVWVLTPEAIARATTIGELLDADRKRLAIELADHTLLLPPSRSRPLNGLLIGAANWDLPNPALGEGDVADHWSESGGRGRRREISASAATPPKGMRLIRILQLETDDEADADTDDVPARRLWHWYEFPHGGESDGPRAAEFPVTLEVHSADVRGHAAAFVDRLHLPPNLAKAVVLAGCLHDIGKRRRAWQLSIGNRNRDLVLAKGGGRFEPRELTMYRHELGSVFDATRDNLLAALEPADRDLALHLVAAHHGRARPHFPEDELFDPEVKGIDFAAAGVEVMLRFAALQRRFGRWGLAYLESLVRAADYAASAAPSAFAEGVR